VQLTQALADVQFEQEKSIRTGDEEASKSRNFELQLKGEKARSTFLENKVQKLENDFNEVNQNLDVWRSAALEQRLRAEQSAVGRSLVMPDKKLVADLPGSNRGHAARKLPLARVCPRRRPPPSRAMARDSAVPRRRRCSPGAHASQQQHLSYPPPPFDADP
jgi:hypothetical protein